MRFFCYNELTPDGNTVVVKSEQEIRQEYYPHWRAKMVEKFGETRVRELVFEDCLDDWVAIHWAWESQD